MHATMKIIGMTCAACSARIERVVAKVEGVESVSVNLATEILNCDFDDSKISVDTVKQAVEKAGYQWAELVKKGAVDEDKIRKENEIKTLWRKFKVSAIFVIPLLYIAMGTMIPVCEITKTEINSPTPIMPMSFSSQSQRVALAFRLSGYIYIYFSSYFGIACAMVLVVLTAA